MEHRTDKDPLALFREGTGTLKISSPIRVRAGEYLYRGYQKRQVVFWARERNIENLSVRLGGASKFDAVAFE
ncbi:MAG: hypothetical protein VW521_07855, partial [Rhodospirillales bacterium]